MLRLEAVEIVQGDWRMTADLALAAGQRHRAHRPVRARARARCSPPSPASSTPARGRILWDGRDITAARRRPSAR